MDIRKKNLLLAALIAAVAIGLYVYTLFHVIAASSH
jgi:hypothetical protein